MQLPQPPQARSQGPQGNLGTVVVFGGCTGPERHMIGAPALAATAPCAAVRDWRAW
jgi:hypothetical protein